MTLDTTIFHYRPLDLTLDQSRCPHCARLIGFGSVVSGDPDITAMADGLFSICLQCAGLSVMEHGDLRTIEVRDLEDIADLPAVVDTICASIRAVRQAKMIAAARWN